MRNSKRKTAVIAALIFYPFFAYMLMRAAPFITDAGPSYLFENLERDLTEYPLRIRVCSNTLRILLFGTGIYAVIILMIVESIKNYRDGEEHGSARWATVQEINRKYAAKTVVFPNAPKDMQDMILTNRARLGFDFDRHGKNGNTLIWGGPGTWKSRGYIIPNIMQMNCNYVITDPKGELAKKCGDMLKKNGYRVVVFDISNPEKSVCYNPFVYFRDDMDVLDFVNNFFAAQENKNAQKMDQFWDDQAKNLMLAFCYLLYYEAPVEEQNMQVVLELLHAAEVSEDEDALSPVDLIFKRLEDEKPGHIAIGYYKDYHKGGAKTLQSIQSTLSSKLAYFNMPAIAKLTVTDDIDIRSFADRKTALFCVTPDSKASLNFLIGTLYQQMFQQLYDLADNVYDGPLPIHIRFLMDEFANIALPDDYQKILSTARSRNMSFAIVLQDKSQIEKIFDSIYKTLMANCSSWLFLGSNEKETCEYFSVLVGKETVYVKSTSRSYGLNGNYTVQVTPQQRDLMTPDEMRRKANRIAICIIEGENALQDEKYNMKQHPNYWQIAEGKNLKRKENPVKIYNWGTTELSKAHMQYAVSVKKTDAIVNLDDVEPAGTVLSEEELLRRLAA
ncbi:MAG: VirD4-like conjugal transfer protein, CD1115 family [Wujia sp.]